MQQISKALSIAPPDPDFYPRKANIYDEVIKQNASLAPVFPFTHPGSIFTGTANLRGDRRPSSRFEHWNSVDEILLCLGSSLGQLRTGQVFVQSGSHDVSGIDSGSADDYLVFYYLQRQKTEGSQRESIKLHCEKCNKILFAHEIDWSTRDCLNASGRGLIPTIAVSEQWAVEVNRNPELRKCAACGHESGTFPNEGWGWTRYAVNAELAGRAELAMQELAS